MLHHWFNNHREASWGRIVEALQRLGGYQKIVANIQSRTSPLGHVLPMWFQKDPSATWEKLAIALTNIGCDDIAAKVRSRFVDTTVLTSDKPETKGHGTPQLKDLVLLKITAWFNLGLRLGIDEHVLNLISRDNKNDTPACCCAMFSQWLSDSEQATYQQLIEALCDINEITAAKQLHEEFGVECERLIHDMSGEVREKPVHTYPSRLPDDLRIAKVSPMEEFTKILCSYYDEHQLFPPDQWPPRLREFFVNLALVQHERFPVQGSLGDFEKTTLHGSVDDLCFKKYNIELEQILKPDSFLTEKKDELKQEQEVYQNQLVRLLNMSTPDFLKKRLNIPLDDGKGLPSEEKLKGVLKQPSFFSQTTAT